jgi:UDP-N-acetylglucosamine 2-epimerase
VPIHFFKNVPPEHFIELLLHARCIVGNSSVAIRECAFLGVPAVNIGTRQRGRERGPNVIDVPYDADAILEGVRRQSRAGRMARSELYGDGRAGERIADVLHRADLLADKRLTY